jgi:hypothetical protein
MTSSSRKLLCALADAQLTSAAVQMLGDRENGEFASD